MHQVVPPLMARTSRTGMAELPLRLVRLVRRQFTTPMSRVDGVSIARYFTDLTAPFGVPYHGGESWHAQGTAYPDMVESILAEALGDAAVDLVVLATSLPDLDPWRSAATRLNHLLGQPSPLLFAVSDQGPAATFTALRLAGELTRRHDLRRVLVLAMDQWTQPYPMPAAAAAGGDAVVALVLARDDGRLFVGQRGEVAADEVAATVAVLVAGTGRTVAEHVDMPPGQPCTGGWFLPVRTVAWSCHQPDSGDLAVCVAVGQETP